MDVTQTLTDIGLEEREVKIYLAALELGASTVLPLAQKAGIKRTYAYDILERLRERQLVSYIEKNGRRRYSAEPPEKLEQLLKNRLENFHRILPELKSIANQAETKPKVRFYEGLEGIETIYAELHRTDAYAAIASAAEVESHFHALLERLADHVVKHDVWARELLVKTDAPIDFIKRYTTNRQQVRWLPEGVKLATDTLLFDNKLVLISYQPDIHAVVIEGSSQVETQKQLFELLWQQAEPNQVGADLRSSAYS